MYSINSDYYVEKAVGKNHSIHWMTGVWAVKTKMWLQKGVLVKDGEKGQTVAVIRIGRGADGKLIAVVATDKKQMRLIQTNQLVPLTPGKVTSLRSPQGSWFDMEQVRMLRKSPQFRNPQSKVPSTPTPKPKTTSGRLAPTKKATPKGKATKIITRSAAEPQVINSDSPTSSFDLSSSDSDTPESFVAPSPPPTTRKRGKVTSSTQVRKKQKFELEDNTEERAIADDTLKTPASKDPKPSPPLKKTKKSVQEIPFQAQVRITAIRSYTTTRVYPHDHSNHAPVGFLLTSTGCRSN